MGVMGYGRIGPKENDADGQDQQQIPEWQPSHGDCSIATAATSAAATSAVRETEPKRKMVGAATAAGRYRDRREFCFPADRYEIPATGRASQFFRNSARLSTLTTLLLLPLPVATLPCSTMNDSDECQGNKRLPARTRPTPSPP
jgi:hypothetical protein